MFKYSTQIQEVHLDFLGHMNNARYFELFEQARWALITQNGYGLDKIRQTGQGPIILEMNIRYIKELKHREHIDIFIELIEQKGKIAKLKQQMKNSKNEVCAELLVTFGLFDIAQRKLIQATPEWISALSN